MYASVTARVSIFTYGMLTILHLRVSYEVVDPPPRTPHFSDGILLHGSPTVVSQ